MSGRRRSLARILFGCLELLAIGGSVVMSIIPYSIVRAEATPQFVWTRQFNSTDYASPDVAIDSTSIYVAGDDDGLRKYDLNGNLLWKRDFGACVAVGSGVVYASDGWNWIRKYDDGGNELWTREVDSAEWEYEQYAPAAMCTYSGSLYVTGESFWGGSGDARGGFLRRYDTQGNENWTSEFESVGLAFPMDVSADSTGVYVVGYTFDETTGDGGSFICKFDQNGRQGWIKPINASGGGAANSVSFGSGGVYVADSNGFLRKYGSAGNSIWSRQIGSSDSVSANSVCFRDGAVYVAGTVYGALTGQTGQGGRDAFVCQYDTAGTVAWSKQFGSSGDDDGAAIAVGSSGIYIGGTAGGTMPNSQGTGSAFLSRLTVAETGDTTPPVAVTDLASAASTSTSVALTWTSPGDDGAVGTASTYDVRYSTAAITDGNWESATKCSGETESKAAGSAETFTVAGLSPDTTYHFALKTADEVPNWSGLSNVVSSRTAAASGPTVVTGAVSGIGTTSATLNGNLTSLGSASSAQVSFEWGLTTAYGYTTTPQTMTATGAFGAAISTLTPGNTYHFRAKVVAGDMIDYGDNRTFDTPSDIDPAAPDTTITNGFSGIIREDRITITWTGADDATPPASLQYSFYLKGRDLVWSPWLPLAEATLTGLADGDYTFMVKARDSAGLEDPTPAEMSFTVDAEWSFAVITDLHIGWGYPDYGGPGLGAEDVEVPGQSYYLTDRLKATVDRLNSMPDVDFVVVLGDISDTAEESEFVEARQILNQLSVPYVPLLGNHDAEQYTEVPDFRFDPDDARSHKLKSGGGSGDEVFARVFWGDGNSINVTRINQLFGETWYRQARLNSEFALQNYCFQAGGIKFVGLDTVTRPGQTGIETWHGETEACLSSLVKDGDSVILLSHIPLDLAPLPAAVSAVWDRASVLASFAGHVHTNAETMVGSLFRSVLTSSVMRESTSFKGVNQSADCIRVVTLSYSSKQILKMDTVAVPESANMAPAAYFTCSSDTVGRFTAYPYCPPGGSDDWQYLWQFEGSVSGPATWCGDRAVDWLAPGRRKVTLTVRNGTNTSYEHTMQVDVWAVLSAHCPVDLLVTDPSGITAQKNAGLLNGMCYRELDIDGDGDIEDVVAIPDHLAGGYSITVVPDEGVQAGDTYTLLVELPGYLAFAAIDIPVENGVAHSYSAVWEEVASGEGTVTVQIDSNGDGEFERTVTSDGEFTADEFQAKAGTPVHLWVYLAAGAGGLAVLGILGASLALLLRRRPAR